MTQFLNQFAQTPEKGAITLDHNFNNYNASVDSTEATPLLPGQAVTIVGTSSTGLIVTAATLPADLIFGFATYQVREDNFPAGATLKVAGDYTVMTMEASAAITAGAELEIVVAGEKVVTRTTGNSIGIALESAAADGDLINVLIKTLNT